MSHERLVFPVVIQGYGEIKGMNGWQDFIRHYRQLVETNNYRGRYIDAVEEHFDGDDMEHLKPEHYKMAREA